MSISRKDEKPTCKCPSFVKNKRIDLASIVNTGGGDTHNVPKALQSEEPETFRGSTLIIDSIKQSADLVTAIDDPTVIVAGRAGGMALVNVSRNRIIITFRWRPWQTVMIRDRNAPIVASPASTPRYL